MRIIATKIKMSEAEPGDILSSYGQLYWDNFCKGENLKPGDLGASVYIRSTEPIATESVVSIQTIYRLKIVKREV